MKTPLVLSLSWQDRLSFCAVGSGRLEDVKIRTAQQPVNRVPLGIRNPGERRLLIPLLMAILPKSFLSLVRRDLMTLSFFTTRHTQIIF
jgi:hypothetical protein